MKLKKGFILRDILGTPTLIGEGVAQVSFDKLLAFNSASAYLWQSVEGKEFTVETLAELLCQRYEVTKEVATCDAAALVEAWKSNGLVE